MNTDDFYKFTGNPPSDASALQPGVFPNKANLQKALQRIGITAGGLSLFLQGSNKAQAKFAIDATPTLAATPQAVGSAASVLAVISTGIISSTAIPISSSIISSSVISSSVSSPHSSSPTSVSGGSLSSGSSTAPSTSLASITSTVPFSSTSGIAPVSSTPVASSSSIHVASSAVPVQSSSLFSGSSPIVLSSASSGSYGLFSSSSPGGSNPGASSPYSSRSSSSASCFPAPSLSGTSGNEVVTLSWKQVKDGNGNYASIYYVTRSPQFTSGSNPAKLIVNVSSSTPIEFDDASVSNGSTYSYTVEASGGCGTGPASNSYNASPSNSSNDDSSSNPYSDCPICSILNGSGTGTTGTNQNSSVVNISSDGYLIASA